MCCSGNGRRKRPEINDWQVREIAAAAFKARFGDIEVVNVKPGLDHYDDPLVNVKIIYDGTVEQLIGPDLLRVRSEIVDKVWRNAEDSPVWPQVHFIAKSGIGRRDPATAGQLCTIKPMNNPR